jgi:methylmalonyl-CoA mutase
MRNAAVALDSGTSETAGSSPTTPPPLRFVTAASLFDGHDAAINMIRRLLQSGGAEVIHLGHNRSVEDIVRAAIQEDADGVAVSSYQGGHNEYFAYMVDMLRERGAAHIRVVVGGGGTISPDEIAALEKHGVEKIYTPEDGRQLGLLGMIEDVFRRVRAAGKPAFAFGPLNPADPQQLARTITALEEGDAAADAIREQVQRALARSQKRAPVVGITGTGGAGKSSLNDELLQRFVLRFPERSIAVVAVDPTRRRSGGALLGDRIRMNSLGAKNIYMRSLATRRQNLATSAVLKDVIDAYQLAGFDLIVVETAGIGQSDTEIVDLVDLPIYVMTSEYGAASQLEKIDMIDYAELVVLNKFEKRGAEDALRDVRKQWRRNHPQQMHAPDADVPVYPTIASRFNDPGVNRLFGEICARLERKTAAGSWPAGDVGPTEFTSRESLIPGNRTRYLAEIAGNGRRARDEVAVRAEAARRAQGLYEALRLLRDPALPAPLDRYVDAALAAADVDGTRAELRAEYNRALDAIGVDGLGELKAWPKRVAGVSGEHYSYKVRGKDVTGDNYTETLSGSQVPKVAVPKTQDWAEILRFALTENLPGHYPYTGGVYPYRREAEDPTRMFAGEGTPERTNRRFHYLARGQAATRLSTAFDSTTLYGEDPDPRPDIYGRTGNSGVSIATLDDMKKLYSGFDLCAPTTSVSMTINGPAPMLLAMFMNTAVDQRVEAFLRKSGRWAAAEQKIASIRVARLERGLVLPKYDGELPEGHDGSGLALLGLTSDELIGTNAAGETVLTAAEHAQLRAEALSSVRGTVQADILKEDQAQNTCIFSTEFALRMMGDVQQFFIDNQVRNFYSVSISGYHIAEAGANPVSQLAFTLANGFTIVEYYLARGMAIDDFAPNLSFFFSNGMDPEYAVIGRVARRIWARAMRDRYGAAARSQMLKYHIQTSGRSLHAREIQFNDIRTTLQAMYALFDNCNSLHTNAYDEALTTPTEESVRRAVAIQLIINRELGLNKIQNPWQGSWALEYLTDMVEEAVYREFDSISERGGVLGAMETMYQRGKIQEESLYYETKKHDGSLPIIGVNTFLSNADATEEHANTEVFRSSEEEKQAQVAAVRSFQARNAERGPAVLDELQRIAAARGNVFGALMDAVKTCSLGQISRALYQVGGQYRRNM